MDPANKVGEAFVEVKAQGAPEVIAALNQIQAAAEKSDKAQVAGAAATGKAAKTAAKDAGEAARGVESVGTAAANSLPQVLNLLGALTGIGFTAAGAIQLARVLGDVAFGAAQARNELNDAAAALQVLNSIGARDAAKADKREAAAAAGFMGGDNIAILEARIREVAKRVAEDENFANTTGVLTGNIGIGAEALNTIGGFGAIASDPSAAIRNVFSSGPEEDRQTLSSLRRQLGLARNQSRRDARAGSTFGAEVGAQVAGMNAIGSVPISGGDERMYNILEQINQNLIQLRRAPGATTGYEVPR
jgi:hypothetical protein